MLHAAAASGEKHLIVETGIAQRDELVGLAASRGTAFGSTAVAAGAGDGQRRGTFLLLLPCHRFESSYVSPHRASLIAANRGGSGDGRKRQTPLLGTDLDLRRLSFRGFGLGIQCLSA